MCLQSRMTTMENAGRGRTVTRSITVISNLVTTLNVRHMKHAAVPIQPYIDY